MHEFRLVIAVIEGPVGLTHRSRNVSSFNAFQTKMWRSDLDKFRVNKKIHT